MGQRWSTCLSLLSTSRPLSFRIGWATETIWALTKAAFVTASRYSGKLVVLASSEQIDFKKPIEIGEIVEAEARVDRLGSLAAAAERLNVTQSALSHTIRKLEQRYGVPMWEKWPKSSFDRSWSLHRHAGAARCAIDGKG
jgi:hypothetical protein